MPASSQATWLNTLLSVSDLSGSIFIGWLTRAAAKLSFQRGDQWHGTSSSIFHFIPTKSSHSILFSVQTIPLRAELLYSSSIFHLLLFIRVNIDYFKFSPFTQRRSTYPHHTLCGWQHPVILFLSSFRQNGKMVNIHRYCPNCRANQHN